MKRESDAPRPTRYLFRLRAGLTYGWGHLIRSLTLATHITSHEHGDQDAQPTILIAAEGDGAVRAALEKSAFSYVMLPDWESDISATHEVSLLNDYKPDISIFDMLSAPAEMIARHRDIGGSTVLFDDLSTVDAIADLTIWGQALDGKDEPGKTREGLLKGPAYFIVSDSVRRNARNPESNAKPASNILICAGGSVTAETFEQIAAIAEHLVELGFNAEVLIGFDHEASVGEIVRLERLGIICTRGTNDIGARMAKADIAIATSGFVKYELAAVGLPTLLVSIIDHQEVIGRDFARSGCAQYLGRLNALSAEEVAAAIADLASKPDMRVEMARCGRELVDGRGLERVHSALFNLTHAEQHSV
jgi:UDP-2,4-diacetamido-2,4,6-trideoxy-beta-L-altropyranose hydrolase